MPIDDEIARAMRHTGADALDVLTSALCRRLRDDMLIASQQDAQIVAAMAREAEDDRGLIDGAVLTEREARALWTLEALGCGRADS